MSFSNATRFAALDLPTLDVDGREMVVAIVKGTFEVDAQGRVRRADRQTPIRPDDILLDENNATSSVRYPSDACIAKRGTDVVVVAEAVSARPVLVMDVAIKVRDVTVPLRVHGPRVFFRHATQIAISDAAPFERQALTYEKAFGGASEDSSVVDMRNPSGVGIAKKDADLIDRPAPQIEHPAFPHRSPRDRHPPVGFGAVRPHWSPRRECAGTFDETWKTTRMPLMPKDFDVRHNNVAHSTLVFEHHVRAGDAVGLLGMSLSGFLGFAVPAFPIVIRAKFDGVGVVEERPPIDLMLIEPGAGRVEIAVRKAFPLGRGRNVLRGLTVDVDG